MKELVFAFYMLVGTYTGTGSEGIYVYGIDPETARTQYVGMAKVDNPSYLAVSDDGRTVYAVSENDGGISYANTLGFDPATSELVLLDSEPTTGDTPCYISSNGRMVVTANYGGGDLSVFGIEEDGELSPLRQLLRLPEGVATGRKERPQQQGSHMHCAKFSPDGRYLFAVDLGTDKILRYDVYAADSHSGNLIDERSLVCFDVPEGSGPRHIIFDATGQNLYLMNEFSGNVAAFRYNCGYLETFQTVSADIGGGHGSADVVLTPDGRYLYASNRLKEDGIACFSVSPDDGTLTPVGYRNTDIHPRNLSITPGGKFLLSANTVGGTIEKFEIDRSSGELILVDGTISVARPACVVYIAAE